MVGDYSPARRAICEANLEAIGVNATYLSEPDCDLPVNRSNIKAIEQAIDDSGARVIVTHALEDTHQDHRATRLMVETAIRRRPISLIEMDSPSVTPAWQPNCWQPIDPEAKHRLLAPYLPHVGEDLARWWECPHATATVRGIPACERFKTIQWWCDR